MVVVDKFTGHFVIHANRISCKNGKARLGLEKGASKAITWWSERPSAIVLRGSFTFQLGTTAPVARPKHWLHRWSFKELDAIGPRERVKPDHT